MEFGILNFEHFFTLVPSVLNYDEHWKKMNKQYGIQMNSSIDEFSAHMVFFFSYIRENPEYEAKLLGLLDRMAARGATISTAINVLASAADKTDFFTSFEYFPIRRKPGVNYSKKQIAQLDYAFESMMHYVKIAHDKGVKIRIGTDCRFGGESLLRESILFEKAGIPIEDILQIATLSGYESMKLDEDFGSIEVGKKADLVLFEKDPFKDINHLLSEKTVVKGGQLFNLKRSLSHDLLEVMIDEGAVAGAMWYQKAKTNADYAPLDPIELKHTTRQLFGTGLIDEAKEAYDIYSKTFPKLNMNLESIWLMNCTYALLRNDENEKAIDFYNFVQSSFPDTVNSIPLALTISILDGGLAAGLKRYEEIKTNPIFDHNENEMNGVGYLFLQKNKLKEAIEIFKINTAAFPDSWNAFDSLGEGYMADGQKDLAIKNYEKSIQLNPENEYGKEQLVKLRKL